jgi:diguanylate cyclase
VIQGDKEAHSPEPSSNASLLHELLTIMLEEALAPRLEQLPDLAKEAHRIADEIKHADANPGLEQIRQDIKRLCVDIEMQGAGSLDQQERLRGLLQLLIDNIGELMDDDSWLHGQLQMIKESSRAPPNLRCSRKPRNSSKT